MSTEKPYPASAPPSEDAWLQPRDVEVSWLGVIDRLLPSRRNDASGADEAVSPLTVAGAAPASHRLPCRIAAAKLARKDAERYRCSMILIVGGSGAVGIPTLRHLVAHCAAVRVLTSRTSSAERLRKLGAREAVIGDFRKPEDLRHAFDGVEAVIQIPPRFTEDEAAIGLNVVAAAKEAGVAHYVFVSAFHPQMRQMDHHWAKLLVEEAVIESGLAYTILQPAMFMQNIRIEWPAIRAHGIYARPYSPERRWRSSIPRIWARRRLLS